MKPSVIAALAAAALLAGCATAPENIAASYVSPVTYQAWTCPQLVEESARIEAALTTASAAQRRTRTNDMVGVALLGLPVASMSGNGVADQIASLRGQQQVVAQTMITKDCARQPAAPAA